ncbi:patatin-like phospholipase family protein [Eubacterium oxidoreducens]|uniref:Predicted phospholipase, patatin/cPLA2 family n=1 Tax=Eubacterium oxidoreducens TaxID=1732 RepID=A0A1G6CEL3_EUBOX|nr:patatin family protein [Eubacterium oxidoreducens]SDB31316.1 Predicted phospholipase, patatin/cPLA2 family [Eubacterium oxidoreducens]
MSKIGLVVEGGGMKCAYSAAVLDAFLEHDIHFDYAIGVSAGSANVASYLSGQKGRARRFYTDHISDPLYFGMKSFLKTGNLFNLQYIYGEISGSDGKDPIDYAVLSQDPTEYYVVATDAKTGTPVYFTKDKMAQDDYRTIMASSAIPAACKPVEIDGHKYFDGGVSDSIPVQHALDHGCDKVVVIMSKMRDFVKTPEKNRALYTLLCMRYPNMIKALNHRHIMYGKCQRKAYELEKEGKAFVFAPSKALDMSTYAMDAAANQKLYELGLLDYRENEKKLQEFLQD